MVDLGKEMLYVCPHKCYGSVIGTRQEQTSYQRQDKIWTYSKDSYQRPDKIQIHWREIIHTKRTRTTSPN